MPLPSSRELCFHEFLKDLNSNDDWSILVGNGLGLSHSNKKIKRIFEFDSFGKNQIQKVFDMIVKYPIRNPVHIASPEKFLDLLRIEAAFTIFQYYRKKEKNINTLLNTDNSKENLREFLKKFKKGVFCINYDSLLYKSIFEKPDRTSGKTSFTDGFDADWISSKTIIERIKKGRIPLYYLHGAYMLLWKVNKNQSFFKISATEKLSLHKAINKKFTEIIRNFRKGNHFEELFVPVLAARSIYKKAIIKENKYLKYCYNELKIAPKIFAFGCSFEKDEHLLEALFSDATKKSIRIGIYSDKDRDFVESWIKERKPNMAKFDWQFVCTKIAGSIIWGGTS